MLSVVLPSRGRPESLARAVASLAKGKPHEILVGLDDDDPLVEQSSNAIIGYDGVKGFIRPRMSCQAAYFNYLAKQATGDVIVLFSDDYTVDQENWVELAQRTMDCLPWGYGVGYLRDPMYPYFSTFPMVHKKTIALNNDGDFLPSYYPFLFGDTHWNEIGAMSAMILPSEASVTINPETGHIHKYSDLRLYSELFHELRPLRAEIALNLINAAFGHDPKTANGLIAGMPERAEALQRMHATCMTEEFYARCDGKHGGHVHPDYPAMKAKAESALAQIRADKALREAA